MSLPGLLIEQDHHCSLELVEYAKFFGYDFDVARNAHKAKELFPQKKYRVVIAEPAAVPTFGKDICEFLAQIRIEHETPVILHSVHFPKMITDHFMPIHAGIHYDRFILKATDPHDLTYQISKYAGNALLNMYIPNPVPVTAETIFEKSSGFGAALCSMSEIDAPTLAGIGLAVLHPNGTYMANEKLDAVVKNVIRLQGFFVPIQEEVAAYNLIFKGELSRIQKFHEEIKNNPAVLSSDVRPIN